jgi:hypothetical protein
MPTSIIDALFGRLVVVSASAILTKIHSSKKLKAIVLVLTLLVVTFTSVTIAFHTKHAYTPLFVLGIFYGVVLSYPATKFLGPKLQAALGGMLGGLTLGNVSSKVASVRSGILALSKQITDTVQQFGNTGPVTMAPYIQTGIVFCVWTTIITVFLIVVVQAYSGEDLAIGAGAAAAVPAPPAPAATPAPIVPPPVTNASSAAAGVEKI